MNTIVTITIACITILLTRMIISTPIVFGDDTYKTSSCMNKAIERTIEIRSLPEKSHIHTLDNQDVPLKRFYEKCRMLFPLCTIHEKFYYWSKETRTITSSTPKGRVVHRIRSYHNCISTHCPHRFDPQKIHGDVAEFYDEEGSFMGFAVYMGDGKYCALPYDGYGK